MSSLASKAKAGVIFAKYTVITASGWHKGCERVYSVCKTRYTNISMQGCRNWSGRYEFAPKSIMYTVSEQTKYLL